MNASKLERIILPLAPRGEQDIIVCEIEKQFAHLDETVESLRRIKASIMRYETAVLRAASYGRLVPTEAELARRDRRDYESGEQLLLRILDGRRERFRDSGKYHEPAWPDAAGMPQLPVGWTWASVDAVGEVLLGRQRAPQYLTGRYPVPYLRVANIKEDRIDFSDLEQMDFDSTHFKKYRLQPGDILVSEGQSPELLGQSAIFRGYSRDLCFQKTLHRFRQLPFSVTAEYAQIVFRSHVHTGVFRRLGSITTNIAHLTLEKFKITPFPLPPLAEQRRIVAEVDRLCSNVRAIDVEVESGLHRCERLRQSVLRVCFADGARAGG